MIKIMCAVYDTVSKVYAPPFYVNTKGEALRSLANAVNDKNMGDLAKHPKDFILFEVGSWDDLTGRLESVVPPERLAIASDFVEVVPGNGKVLEKV